MEERTMKKSPLKKVLAIVLVLVLSMAMLSGCGGKSDTPKIDKNKTHITFGAARPLSGVYQVFEESVFGPVYKMWVDEVNAAGGIYVEEYGKKLLIDVKTYDDTSDMATMVRMTEKLILEDKVDLMLPSCSTAFVFAQAEITNKYGKLLISAEGGSAELSASYDNTRCSSTPQTTL